VVSSLCVRVAESLQPMDALLYLAGGANDTYATRYTTATGAARHSLDLADLFGWIMWRVEYTLCCIKVNYTL